MINADISTCLPMYFMIQTYFFVIPLMIFQKISPFLAINLIYANLNFLLKYKLVTSLTNKGPSRINALAKIIIKKNTHNDYSNICGKSMTL